MKGRCIGLVALLVFLGAGVWAQSRRAMTFDDLTGWQRVTERAISDDGVWVACRMEPWIGDAMVHVYNAKGKEVASFQGGEQMKFAASCRYLLAVQKPPLKEVEALKIQKTKEEDLPKNKLLLHRLAEGKTEEVDSVKVWKLAEKSDWLAYQRGNKADSTLYIRSLEGNRLDSFPAVSEFYFAKEVPLLYFVSKGDTLGTRAGLYAFEAEAGASRLVFEGEGVFKQIVPDKRGEHLAFLYCADKDSVSTHLKLHVDGQVLEATPTNWVMSEHETIRFSDDSQKLFFGMAPRPKVKDTTVLDENRPKVEIWKWDEKVQYTQQVYNKAKDLKKSYTAVYHLNERKLVPLASPEMPDFIMADKGNAPIGLLRVSEPYGLERMWTGRPRYDIYSIDLASGQTDCIKEALMAEVRFSPKGNYAYWFNVEDSSWYSYSIADKKEYRLTTPDTFAAWDEENDMPDFAPPYGVAGWTSPQDEYLLLYDRYDLWRFDPKGRSAPVNLTKNGRTTQTSYRLLQLDKEATTIDPKKEQLLRGFNEVTKGYGYYRLPSVASASVPQTLLAGNFMLKEPLKAKKSGAMVYTTETYSQFPELRLTADGSFKRPVQLTNGQAQQDGIRWGTAELVSWTSLDGKPLQGVVYKPEDFDPAKKYPLIVNFYERNAETLYAYKTPEPHRSTIDYRLYNSHEYIVFNPDVVYEDGYPGESCFNSVMPGISLLISQGYINEEAIAAQGHSWGGYQVAYLATRTRLFAAIESGAPVVNMFSAYGGIRWGSGLNRSFQYEHTQSRIGATIWEAPQRYTENSPLFTMDKVETPILIMHNDQDGHVPWYQGIEYFVALKRLQKPVWMLNYPGEIHWPMRMANRVDFQKRMFQFFEHYLKKKPMPRWMSEGVPAVDQDFELGYE
ncbi:dipeptidyl aminopeptidase/acylaminoacyl peptidase [Parabacteroides sp. PF5-5]|nr:MULTISPECIES: prolyl oligopeptidase family serine peptidase [unclassified Parabacteroides]MDH6303592.1 dipeptidyl aminopeptidase/acylaminoacyl peptidase [Parabacteroides sp. PH5-39]MDH6314914.1 dipeptidyl aminopeptidase/acylaminoacyl peptidase [Parabacteroides sp. PF5-13]MDH6318251.1 dipeptidyl aminopeptidase/acylaminoacyl peptidase [Parabacteroides sp. PH5-13]MDH6321816.1 dipeptidyl aminopeptidase/acylaminoacyl peptidase [Parabacteroides sp. PH5-8]MDH6325940.1 dipeptidyl aminopeptidase/acy